MLDADVSLLQSQSRSVMGTDIRNECSVCRVDEYEYKVQRVDHVV